VLRLVLRTQPRSVSAHFGGSNEMRPARRFGDFQIAKVSGSNLTSAMLMSWNRAPTTTF